jgi:predicted phosphatase
MNVGVVFPIKDKMLAKLAERISYELRYMLKPRGLV